MCTMLALSSLGKTIMTIIYLHLKNGLNVNPLPLYDSQLLSMGQICNYTYVVTEYVEL